MQKFRTTMSVMLTLALVLGFGLVATGEKTDKPNVSTESNGSSIIDQENARLEYEAFMAESHQSDAAHEYGKAAMLSLSNVSDKPEWEGPENVPAPFTQGGDLIGSATAITALPHNSTGTTGGYTHDYDEVCPYTGSTAPDVVYSYVCTADISVDIDLLGSAYDTKLYVYEDAETPGAPYACNDDYYSDYVSALWALGLTAGHTYYIVIDGYGTNFGDYVLTVTEYEEPDPFDCPDGAFDEAEACGDDTNGGCNMTTPAFEPINCGDTVCGTVWADGGTRDTDWYELVLTEPNVVTWTGTAEFLFVIGFVDTSDCLIAGALDPYATGNPGDVITCSRVAGPGTYWLFASHQAYEGSPCGTQNGYWAAVDCEPITEGACCDPLDGTCTPDVEEAACLAMYGGTGVWMGGFTCDPNPCPQPTPPNDDCADAEWVGDVTNHVCPNTCEATHDGPGLHSITGPNVWYCYTATCSGDLTISLCGSDYDTKIVVYEGCYCTDFAAREVAYNDDACGVQSEVTFSTLAGVDYLIEVAGYSAGCGNPLLSISCVEITEGACCDPATGDCTPDMEQVPCEAMYGGTGVWMPGMSCTPNPCPQPPSEGDNCADPIKVELPGDMPYCDTNYTCGRVNDYPNTDMCYTLYGNGEDAVYEVDVTAPTTMKMIMDPMGTSWTYVQIGLECPPVASTCVYYFRYSGGTEYESDPITLAVGTYYIIVDTWPSPDCIPNYELCIEEEVPCIITCPPGSADEGEPCGDDVNGGCNMATPQFTDADCDVTYCGTGWEDAGTRDTDWYMLELAGNYEVTLTMTAEFEYVFGFIEYNPGSEGSGSCNDITGYIAPYATGLPCDTLSLTLELSTGLWMIFAGPLDYYDNPCDGVGETYWLDFSCVELASSELTYDPTSFYFGPVPSGATGGDVLTLGAVGNAMLTYSMDIAYGFKNGAHGNANMITAASWPEKPPYDGPESQPDELVFTQGGDLISSAFAIPTDVYTGSGTTAGYNHDYDEVCPYTGSTAPDVVYSYACTADNIALDVDMFGSAYDTKIYIYEDGETPGSPYACNDDYYSDYVSALWDIPLNNGHTYYIVIDGYGTSSGAYTMLFDAHTYSPCVVECPAGALDEAEGCGNDTNGGCNSPSPIFTDASCGDIFCGSGWMDGGTRDTDWYMVGLTGGGDVTLTMTAEFPFLVGFVAYNPGSEGSGDCADITGGFSIYGTGNPCDTVIVTQTCTSGDWMVFAGPSDFYDYPCSRGDTTYWLEIACPEQPPEWLTVAPTGGTIDYGFTEDVDVTYDATDLEPDIYYADVIITHDGTNGPETVVPVTLEVSAAPECLVDPDPLYAAYIWAVPPMVLDIYLGGSWPYDVNTVNLSTLMINGVLTPSSATVVTGHPAIGEAIKMEVGAGSFIGLYMPLYGTGTLTYTITGEFNDATPFSKDCEVAFVGHLAGDMNLDGAVNIVDLTYFVQYLFGGGPEPRLMELADVNQDQNVNIVDLTYMVAYLFAGGPAPQHP